jgi:hypothetical protein
MQSRQRKKADLTEGLRARREQDFPPFVAQSEESIHRERRRIGLEPPLHTSLSPPSTIKKIVSGSADSRLAESLWEQIGRSKRRDRTPLGGVVVKIRQTDPRVDDAFMKTLEAQSELERKRAEVARANNILRFRQRYGREPTDQEARTGRPGPIGGR